MIKKVQQWFPLIILVTSVVVAVMAFLPGLAKDDTAIAGFKLAFGGYGKDNFLGVKDAGFSFPNFLAYFGPVVIAIVVAILGALDKNTGIIKLVLGFVTAAMFVLAVIFIIRLSEGAYTQVTVLGSTVKTTLKSLDFKLAWGAIVALIAAILGVVASTGYAFMQVMEK